MGELARDIGGVQKPLISSPQGQSFPIPLLSEEDRRRIPLASPKPQVLRVQARDESDLDPLKLGPALRAQLRAASTPQMRGQAGQETPFVYRDQVVDEVPDAIIPVVVYKVTGGKLQVQLRLNQNDARKKEINLETSPEQAVKALVRALEGALR